MNGVPKCCRWANGHHNKTNSLWVSSASGKEYTALGYHHLPFQETTKKWVKQPYISSEYKTFNDDENKTCCILCNTNNTYDIPQHKSELIEMRLNVSNNKYRVIRVLLDTGAYQDYINMPTAKWLTDNGKVKEIGEVTICSAFTNICHDAKHKINIELSFKNEFSSIRSLVSKATIIDSDIDIILGRRTIANENLVMHYPSQFMREDFVGKILALFPYRVGITEGAPPLDLLDCIEQANQQLGQLVNWGEAKQDTSARVENPHRVCSCHECIATLSTNFSTIPAHLREDLYGIENNQLESFPSDLLNKNIQSANTSELPTNIWGPVSLQKGIRTLLQKYEKKFSTTVNP